MAVLRHCPQTMVLQEVLNIFKDTGVEGMWATCCSFAAAWIELMQLSWKDGCIKVFLEQVGLNPALSTLLRKRGQLQGIWPPA